MKAVRVDEQQNGGERRRHCEPPSEQREQNENSVQDVNRFHLSGRSFEHSRRLGKRIGEAVPIDEPHEPLADGWRRANIGRTIFPTPCSV
jgi:hypothetical protein